MMRLFKFGLGIVLFCHVASPAFSLEVAPRLTDREIIESLVELKKGQGNINKRLDDLREDTNKRFEGVDKRFEGIDQRFVEMRQDMNKRFEGVDQRFVEMRQDMNKRFEGVDKRFVEMRQDMNKRFEDVDKRFESVDKRFFELRQDMNKRFDDVNKRLDTSHYTMLTMFSTVITLIVALFGYIAWDRRTLLKPIQEKLNILEQNHIREAQSLQENSSRLQNLLDALRNLAQKDEKLAVVLRSFSLL